MTPDPSVRQTPSSADPALRVRANLLLVLTAAIWGLGFVAQRHAKPSHAALILSLEAVFGALGGWLLLDEVMSGRMLLGCTLVMAGILVSLRGTGAAGEAEAPIMGRSCDEVGS